MLLGLRDYLYPNYQTQTFWHFMFVTFQKTRTLGPCPEPIYVADKALCRQSTVFTPDNLAIFSVHSLWTEVYDVTTGRAKACPAGEKIRNS